MKTCPAINQKCNKCNKVGHFARACLSNRNENYSRKNYISGSYKGRAKQNETSDAIKTEVEKV